MKTTFCSENFDTEI